MSNVRVNLLPEDIKRRDRQNRRTGMIVIAFVVLLLLIGAAYWWALTEVDEAQAEVDREQETLQARQAELAELQEFEELRTLREEGDQVLAAVMGAEASTAGILQDVAAVMPPDAQLETLTITVMEETGAELGDVRSRFGTMTFNGYTRLGHAPGLERLLLEFDKIAAFSDLYFSDSTVDEFGISTFNAQVDLGPEIRTGRYLDGLPEVLR